MKNVMKRGRLDGNLVLSDVTIDRIGTVGVAAGGLLALIALMF